MGKIVSEVYFYYHKDIQTPILILTDLCSRCFLGQDSLYYISGTYFSFLTALNASNSHCYNVHYTYTCITYAKTLQKKYAWLRRKNVCISYSKIKKKYNGNSLSDLIITFMNHVT